MADLINDLENLGVEPVVSPAGVKDKYFAYRASNPEPKPLTPLQQKMQSGGPSPSPAIGDVEKVCGQLEACDKNSAYDTKDSPCFIARSLLLDTISWLRTLAAEATDAKATLAGQSAHVIDLELAVDRLAAEKDKQERGWNACMIGYEKAAEEIIALRAKLERAREGLQSIVDYPDLAANAPYIARATLEELK